MSIFGNILNKIFPGRQAAGSPAPSTAPATTTAAAPPPASAPTATPATAPMPTVDVEALLEDMAQRAGQPLNWRTSIVDLMKLLQIDSSLSARQALARELGYGGDMGDSAAMNVWLHRQVMTQLARNGGKVPAELRD